MSLHLVPRMEEPDFGELVPPSAPPIAPSHGLAITARQLDKAFAAHRVLRGLTVHVPAGQFVAIVGRSGCGKSTLLRLLLGLEQPSGGRLWFGDGAEPPTRADVRIMFQEPRLLPWATVAGNVEIGLGEQRGTAEGRQRVAEALRDVELAGRGRDWPSVLSGGQKQRVALARALVSRPRVLAFDEPLGALDALTRIAMQSLVERVWLDQQFTAIMVTHDVGEAVALADRVLMLESPGSAGARSTAQRCGELIDDGAIALDIAIDVPRPRVRGSAQVAEVEGRILRELLRSQCDSA